MVAKDLKIYIDPSIQILYSSFYLKGLFEFFGKKNVMFSNRYFYDLNKQRDNYSYESYMAFVIKENEKISKVIIDFGDDSPIRENAYNWCDLYAKVNLFKGQDEEIVKTKILSIAPSFGIRIWNVFEVSYYCLTNLVKLNFKPQRSLKKYFYSYLSQFKARRLERFSNLNNNEETQKKFIFFIASLWPEVNCLTGTNLYRKFFLEVCLRNKIYVQGGFVVNDANHPQFSEFKELIIKKRVRLAEFIEKTKQSTFVFNTPAVHNCHGWKLGQYLAMNKAIISMPFVNSLPEDMEHGKNIHFVSDISGLDEAVTKLLNDDDYRKELEIGAALYYEKYVNPAAVIREICQRVIV